MKDIKEVSSPMSQCDPISQLRALKLNKRSKIIEKLKELTKLQETRMQQSRYDQLKEADFGRDDQDDEHFAILKPK